MTTALGGFGVLLVVYLTLLAAMHRRFRRPRVVRCPATRALVIVEVDGGHALRTAVQGRPQIRVRSCSHWPERADCTQACLRDLDTPPAIAPPRPS